MNVILGMRTPPMEKLVEQHVELLVVSEEESDD